MGKANIKLKAESEKLKAKGEKLKVVGKLHTERPRAKAETPEETEAKQGLRVVVAVDRPPLQPNECSI